MALPVLPSSSEVSPASLLRLYDRALLHWLRHYGDEVDIEVGVAVASAELPAIAQAHTLLDAALPAGAAGVGPQAILGQIDAAFARARAGTGCARIVLNLDQNPPAELSEALLQRGYVQDAVQVLALRQAPQGLAQNYQGLTIIPARASFPHTMALARKMCGGAGGAAERSDLAAAQAEESMQLHLDDPHYDALIALGDGRAVALGGVLAVGEVGLLRQVYVSPDFRRKGVGKVMLARVLDICERAAFRHVLAAVPRANEALSGLLTACGFGLVGQVAFFRKPDDTPGEL